MARRLMHRLAPLRRIAKSGAGQRLIYTARALPLIRRPARFALTQLVGGEEEVVLRRSGRRAILRPGSGDLMMLHQILGRDLYRPPSQVERSLAGSGGRIRIADLGGNVGLFTLQALERWPSADVVAVEADPANADVFARMLGANGLEPQVRLLRAAVSNRNGTVAFDQGRAFRSRVVDEGPGAARVERLDIFPLLADRDFVKIDIEGSEWDILGDERFEEIPARVIAMEWHAHRSPEPEPGVAAVRLLEAAGFSVIPGSSDLDCGTVWAWRE
jgi:FkbM family methyltransferase